MTASTTTAMIANVTMSAMMHPLPALVDVDWVVGEGTAGGGTIVGTGVNGGGVTGGVAGSSGCEASLTDDAAGGTPAFSMIGAGLGSGGAGAGTGAEGGGTLCATRAPHLLQNAAPGVIGLPHVTQNCFAGTAGWICGVPQELQNRCPSE